MMNKTISKSNYIRVISMQNSDQEVATFGFSLPFLPDFLSDHTLLGQTGSEKLEEILSRFERFIIGLRKYRDSSYSLRFISNLESGRIDVGLLGRVNARQVEAEKSAAQICTDLAAHIVSFGLKAKPLGGPESIQETNSLDYYLHPFKSPPAIVEIRQRELIVPLMTINKDAYVIHPYWGPQGACLEPFEVMLRQPEPVAIGIYLEPTEILDQEYHLLSEASFIAQTVSDINIRTYSENSINRKRDPGADLVGNIYNTYLKSLSDPFISLVQVISPEPNAAWTVARSYASAATNRYSYPASSSAEQRLPSGCDIFVPQNQREQSQALLTFSNLIWSPWGISKASLNKERLPYLMGAHGASTIFRFPVSVKGGIPGIAVRQAPPDFEPGGRPKEIGDKEVHLGNLQRGGAAVIQKKDFTRHALITGFTGSGKTNTVLYLLDQVWRKGKTPFLVIEAAKKEYRSMLRVPGFEELLIFTLGDETTSPFRLNPFELLPGVRLESHLGRLQACFDAALPQFGILPSVVAEAMEGIYKKSGWRLTDRAAENENRLFPTMRDMFDEVIRVAETRGYAGETYQNIRAAAAGRIGNLLRGSKGRMFGSQRSFPAEVLLNRPVIIELNDLNEDDKSLTMMFLLTWLREYRELHTGKTLQHLTVVEEAHNVLSNVQSTGNSEISADTKAKAVAAFSNMLSEVRAYGEGIIISDQSPEKLAPDAIRNTNLQIAHQLRDMRDREAIARAMIMDSVQQDYLAKLRIGEAAMFQTGIEKATFIKVPEYKDTAGFDLVPSDDEVRKWMSKFQNEHFLASLPFDGCRFCKSQCLYRESIEPYTLDKENHEQLVRALKKFDEYPQREHWPNHWKGISEVCRMAAEQAGHPDELDAAYCYLAHEIDFPFTEHMRKSFEIAFS